MTRPDRPLEELIDLFDSQKVVIGNPIKPFVDEIKREIEYGDPIQHPKVQRFCSHLGALMMVFPDAEYTDRAINYNPCMCDPVVSITARLLNSPYANEDNAVHGFKIDFSRVPSQGCSYAEPGFLRTLVSLERSTNQGPISYNGLKLAPSEVLIDENGEPILFKKSIGESTAISLVETRVGGWIFPPGSLFAEPRFNTEVIDVIGQKIVVKRHTDAVKLDFLRLTGYAVDPSERQKYFDFRMKSGKWGVTDWADNDSGQNAVNTRLSVIADRLKSLVSNY